MGQSWTKDPSSCLPPSQTLRSNTHTHTHPGGSGCQAPATHADGHFSSLVVGIGVDDHHDVQGSVLIWGWGQSSSGDAKVRPRLRTTDAENATHHILPGLLRLPASASSPCAPTFPSHAVSSHQATEEVFQAILSDGVIAPVCFLHSESCSKPSTASTLHGSGKFPE